MQISCTRRDFLRLSNWWFRLGPNGSQLAASAFIDGLLASPVVKRKHDRQSISLPIDVKS
jgi:hypothetical protein